jgi:diguanylate cyclase (GGDEF)-like protein
MLNYTRSVLHIENSLRDKADYDELTKLYNRHKMRVILSQACLNSKENMEHYYISIIDIDDFKSINDNYGHNAGDYVLKRVAEILLKYNNNNMEISRWGGEEFLILQNCNNNLSECFENIELIRSEISNKKFILNKKRIKVTITAGIAKFGHNMTVDEVINMADEYLYKGKNTGKNCVITI